MNKLYTAQEIADKLQIKKTTVYELIKRGELYSSKVGKQLRISEQQLKQYLERSGSGNNMPDQKAVSSSTPNGNLQIPELPPESSLLKRDYLLHSSGLILCGQFSPALELLISQMSIHPQGIPVLQSFMNSYNSLYSLYFKKAHIACASLDLEHIRSLVPGVQLSLLCLYEYSIGLYVPSGNPLKLSGLMDFARKDIKIANREKRKYTTDFTWTSFFSQKKFCQPAYLVTILELVSGYFHCRSCCYAQGRFSSWRRIRSTPVRTSGFYSASDTSYVSGHGNGSPFPAWILCSS